ncbi:MAG: hypothetical protein U9R60_03950 [Bacteroidota bacterium]|nr:hypothetical protein [Bacteroidota bacterium]
MEDSRSYIGTLEEYGRKTGREVNTEIKTYKRMRGIGQYGEPETWFVSMQDHPSGTNYFACYYGSNLEVGKYRTFSGVFLPVDVPLNTQLLLSQSDVLDKFSGIFSKRTKTGFKNFDKKTLLKTNDTSLARKLFSKSAVQLEILKSYNDLTGLLIAVNEINITFIPELKGKSNVSAFIRYDWITDGKQIESLFKLGYILQEQLSRI